MMKSFPALLFALFLATKAAAQPNIVFILADDIGTGWIPPYAEQLTVDDLEPEILAAYRRVHGHQGEVDPEAHLATARISMPTLSRLSKEGAVFRRAYATASLCSPSRAGLLTGSFQQTWGAYWNKDVDDHGIPEDRVVLAEPLQAAGYRTGMIGKWHVAKKDDRLMETAWVEDLGQELPIPKHYKGLWPKLHDALKARGWKTSSAPGQHPLDRGFDYYFGYNSYDDQDYGSSTLWEGWERVPERPKGEFLTDLFNRKAVAFIDDALGAGKPFFLYYAPKTLHGAIRRPPEAYVNAFDSGNVFTNEYAGHLLALDKGIEGILETLEGRGQLDNTLFIFSSDNGCTLYNVPPHNAPNRGGKGTGWLGGLNVPLMVWQPGRVRSGMFGDIVSLADLMPTVLDAAGVEVPQGIDGRSWYPFLTGRTPVPPRTSLGSAGLHSSRWSYSYEASGENNKKDSLDAPLYAWYMDGDALLMRVTDIPPGLYQSLPEGLPARTMLYDLGRDPDQRRDLSGEYPDLVRKLDSGLRVWMENSAEPLTSQQEAYDELLQPATP